VVGDQFHCKDPKKTPWILEFIIVIDTGIVKLKKYYSKTGGLVETQYVLATMLNPSQKLDIFTGPG
jgi:hypothetical protein